MNKVRESIGVNVGPSGTQRSCNDARRTDYLITNCREEVIIADSDKQLEALDSKTCWRHLCNIDYVTKNPFAALADDRGEECKPNVVDKKESLRLTVFGSCAICNSSETRCWFPNFPTICPRA